MHIVDGGPTIPNESLVEKCLLLSRRGSPVTPHLTSVLPFLPEVNFGLSNIRRPRVVRQEATRKGADAAALTGRQVRAPVNRQEHPSTPGAATIWEQPVDEAAIDRAGAQQAMAQLESLTRAVSRGMNQAIPPAQQPEGGSDAWGSEKFDGFGTATF